MENEVIDPLDSLCPSVPSPADQLMEIMRMSFEINTDELYTVILNYSGPITKWDVRVCSVTKLDGHVRIYDWSIDVVYKAEGYDTDQKAMAETIKALTEILDETR